MKDYELKRACLLAEQNYCCYTCGEPFSNQNEVQLAHRAIKSKPNIRLFGLDIIDNVKNLRATHGGKCNDAVIINRATRPIEFDEHIKSIEKEIG